MTSIAAQAATVANDPLEHIGAGMFRTLGVDGV